MEACGDGEGFSFGDVPSDGGFRQEGYWVWCGSVVEEPGGGFHMYASRWPKTHPMFEGYLFLSEIVRAWSPALTGPYHFRERVLPSGDPAEWCGRMVHNPAVLRYKDRYLLYFIGSTYEGEAPAPDRILSENIRRDEIYRHIRIGLAVADLPSGPWKTLSAPILEARPGCWDADVVTNPAPCVHPDGRIFLFYRSNTPGGLRIGLAVADRPEGPYRRVRDTPVLEGFNVEDPFVWHDGKRFHMLAKDMTGEITGEKIAGAHFLSGDGVDWRVAPVAKGYSRAIRWDDGRTEHLGCLERPWLFFDAAGVPRCLFAAAGDGAGSFRRARNTWNMALPIR